MRNKYFIFLLFGLFSFASSQSEELSKFKEFSQKFEKAFFDSIDSKKVIDPTTLMPYEEGHFLWPVAAIYSSPTPSRLITQYAESYRL